MYRGIGRIAVASFTLIISPEYKKEELVQFCPCNCWTVERQNKQEYKKRSGWSAWKSERHFKAWKTVLCRKHGLDRGAVAEGTGLLVDGIRSRIWNR